MTIRRLLLLAVLLLQVGFNPAYAQYEGYMKATQAELDALNSANEQKLVRLREQARAILNQNPRSIPGHYLMGYSLHHSEGDLPRARFHLLKARDLYYSEYGKVARSGQPWGWLEKTLMELEYVSGEMDLYEEQITILNQYQSLIASVLGFKSTVLEAAYAWPLMKLNREREAREKLRSVSHQMDEPTRTIYWNTKGALEMETGNAKASYEAFRSLINEINSHGWSMTCTYLRNGGEAAACVGRFDEAERLYLESTEYFDPMSFSNPWWDLANLYLAQARFPEAIGALQKTQLWTYNSQPFLAQQTLAANQQLTCELLLQLGYTEKALSIAESFVDRPDRKGGDSVQRDQWEAANLLIYREALLARRSALIEEMSWAKGWRWWQLLWEQRDLASRAYLAGQRAAAISVTHHRLAKSLRYMYAPGTILIPNYYRPALVGIYGAGATSAALDELLSSRFETLELETPYLQTLEAEVAARTGRREEAVALLTKALEKLPPAEKMLRARCLARIGQLEGDPDKAIKLYQDVMQTAPGMMRILEIPLPVHVSGDSNATLRQVASMVRGSVRFQEDRAGLPIQLSTDGSSLRAVLLGKDGSILSEAQAKIGKDADQSARDLVADIHWKFFAPRIDLSQLDTSSLDGSNLTGEAQSNKLKELFFPDQGGPKT